MITRYRLRIDDVLVFFGDVRLQTVAMVESQRADRAREIHGAGSPRAARIEVHAVDVLLQPVRVQIHVIAQRTPDVRVGVHLPPFGRRTDARRRARRRMYVPFGDVIGQFVFGQKRLAAYFAHGLGS